MTRILILLTTFALLLSACASGDSQRIDILVFKAPT